MLKFIYNYLRSMRLYYGFVTGTTVLVGVSIASPECYVEWTPRIIVMFVLGFLAWGVNQIFSDWCDRKEDAINAPHRPMVTGALKPIPAMAVSLVALLAIGIVGYLLSPWSLLFLVIGGALNILYSLVKKIPVLNCLVYAGAISCCAFFAIAGMENALPNIFDVIGVLVLVLPIHFLMCHNSYYKDVIGDREAGVRTLQTLFPRAVSITLTIVMSAIPLAFSWSAITSSCDYIWLAVLLTLLTVALVFYIIRGSHHRVTCLNCQLCVTQLTMLTYFLLFPYLPIVLILIQLLFLWYDDEKE